jgi:hypothetical protein
MPDDFGTAPEAKAISLGTGAKAISFAATSVGVSGSATRLAVLSPGTNEQLDNLLFQDIVISNQGQYTWWTVPSFSQSQVLVTANFVWGPGEGHYDSHRFVISVYTLRSSSLIDASLFYLTDQYMTARRYDTEVDPDILAVEKAEILARLRRVKTQETRPSTKR